MKIKVENKNKKTQKHKKVQKNKMDTVKSILFM